MIKERRRHARLRIPLEAYYRLRSGDDWQEGTIETVGAGGAALICDVELAAGDTLAGLRFTVPAAGGFDPSRVEVAAKVVQVRRQQQGDRPPSFVLGLRFSDIRREDAEHLRKFVFQRLTGTEPPAAPVERSGLEVEPDSARAALGRMLGRAAAREVKLRRRLEGLQQRLGQSEEARKELQAGFEKERGKAEALRRQLGRLEAPGGEVESLRRELRRLEEARDEAEAARARFESRVEEARETGSTLERELEQARTESDRLRGETESATRKLREELEQQRGAQAELGEQLEAKAATEAELRERLDSQLSEARETQAGLEDELREARQETDRRRREAEREVIELREELDRQRVGEGQLREQLEVALGAESRFREQVEKLEGERDDLEERLVLSAAGKIELEGELRELRERGEQLQREWADREFELRSALEKAGVDMASLPDMPLAVGGEPPPLAADEEPAPQLEVPAVDGLEEPAPRAARVDEAGGEPVGEPAPEPTEAAAAPPHGLARRMLSRLGFGRPPEAAEPADGGIDVDEPAGDEGTGKVDPAEVEETVRAWASAWSEQRVEDYLAFYSRDFKPPQAVSESSSDTRRPAWQPPLDGMQLELGPISQTATEPGRVSVRFEQSVESDAYSRRVSRTLELVWEDGAWKIASEAFDESESEAAPAESGA